MAVTNKDLEGWTVILKDENNNIIDDTKKRSRRRNDNVSVHLMRNSDEISFTRGDSIMTKNVGSNEDANYYSVYYIHDIRLNTMTYLVEVIAMTYLGWSEIDPISYYRNFEQKTFDASKGRDYYREKFNEEVDKNQIYLTAELKELLLRDFYKMANMLPLSEWKDETSPKEVGRDFFVRYLCDPDSTNFIEIDFERVREKMLTQDPKSAAEYLKRLYTVTSSGAKEIKTLRKRKSNAKGKPSDHEIKIEDDQVNSIMPSEEDDINSDKDEDFDDSQSKGLEDNEDDLAPFDEADSEDESQSDVDDDDDDEDEIEYDDEYGRSKNKTRTSKKRTASSKEKKPRKKKLKTSTPLYKTAKIKRFTKKNVDRARKKYTPFSKRFKNINDIPDLTKYADFNQTNLDLQLANYEAKLTAPRNDKVVETIFSKFKKQLYSSHAREELINDSGFNDYIPGRGKEFATIYLSLYSAIEAGTASTVYVAGTPGVGKTLTVREVIKELQSSMLQEELPEFQYVEINGLKMVKPTDGYEVLWNKISGERLTWGAAMESLEFYFNKVPKQKKRTVVVLLDELDALVTKAQDIMYNFFNWTTYEEAKLVVIALANTMDLPERHLGNKVSSRIGFTRIMFTGYTHEELKNIIQSKLQGLNNSYFYVNPENGNAVLINEQDAETDKKLLTNIKKVRLKMSDDAIEIAARKVASVSGDARRALKICKRATEIAEIAYMAKYGFKYDGTKVVNENDDDDDDEKFNNDKDVVALRKQKINDGTGSTVEEDNESVQTVHISHIMKALNETVNTYNVQYIKKLSFSARLFLYSFLSLIRKSTYQEQEIGNIIDEIKLLIDVNGNNKFIANIRNTLYQNQSSNSTDENETSQLRIASWNFIINNLIEAGLLLKQTMKNERSSTLKLNISLEEIKKALDFDETLKSL